MCTNLKSQEFLHVFIYATAAQARCFQHLEGSLLPIRTGPSAILTSILRDDCYLFLELQ